MYFEWDESKNEANIRKHGIDFNDAIAIFSQPMLTAEDTRGDYDEQRWLALGYLKHLLAVVVYTERVANSIRIISVRKATRREALRYEQIIKN